MGSPDGCLWRRYICCRAGVHCQFALIRGIHHPKPPHPSLSLSHLHWSEHDTFKSPERQKSILPRKLLTCFIAVVLSMWLLSEFKVISSLVHTNSWIQSKKLSFYSHRQNSNICLDTITAGNQVIIRLAPRDPLTHTSDQVHRACAGFSCLELKSQPLTLALCLPEAGTVCQEREENNHHVPPSWSHKLGQTDKSAPVLINELGYDTAASCKDFSFLLFSFCSNSLFFFFLLPNPKWLGANNL